MFVLWFQFQTFGWLTFPFQQKSSGRNRQIRRLKTKIRTFRIKDFVALIRKFLKGSSTCFTSFRVSSVTILTGEATARVMFITDQEDRQSGQRTFLEPESLTKNFTLGWEHDLDMM